MPVSLDPRCDPDTVALSRRPTLRVGLVNNMPDAALARTERQFIDILETASSDIDVELGFYSVPGIPRDELGNAHLARRGYRPSADLEMEGLDALMVTGTEPKQRYLRDEPYWAELTSLFDWIEDAGPSTLFSCLAAHAAVLHFDGIERHRLPEKRTGLFGETVVGAHPLVAGLPASFQVAHSRWNEVRGEVLERHGYTVLTEARCAGVDLFIKQARNPLLFFQGHPEYDIGALFREFRRDVQRFLAGESESYPQAPQNYFDDGETVQLHKFRARAMSNRHDVSLAELPVAKRAASNMLHSPMAAMFRTWLSHTAAAKGVLPVFTLPAVAPRFGGMHQ